MRCQSCGTQNESDSRFCGGCGARLGTTLAPTQKIVDNNTGGHASHAQVAQRTSTPVPAVPSPYTPLPGTTTTPGTKPASARSSAMANAPAAAPRSVQQPVVRHPPSGLQPVQPRPSSSGPSVAPVSMARPAVAPAPGYPTNGHGAAVAPSPRVAVTEPPEDEAPIRTGRRWGLIIFVLVIDLALAGVGAWMLSEGLASGAPSSGSVRTEAPPAKQSANDPAAPAAPSAPAAPADTKPAAAPSTPTTVASATGSGSDASGSGSDASGSGIAAAASAPSDGGSATVAHDTSNMFPIDAEMAKSVADAAVAATKPAVVQSKPSPTRTRTGTGSSAKPIDPYTDEPPKKP